jgi:hypothetical protein
MLVKDIFGNWTKHCMRGDYWPTNKWIHFNKYAMPLLKKNVDIVGQAKVLQHFQLAFRLLLITIE